MPVPPPNAYSPGKKITVGSHNISIIKYISEGGFAHVYTCTIDPPFNGSTVACLKRVEVPSKWQLSLLRQEVDAMKRLRGNKYIVSYIDSHATRLDEGNTASPDQKYVVFLLMEYCENKGVIDFMNQRLVNKLTETEILDISYQVTIGVAMCHHLTPPLIHRDIKIENVLIDAKGTFKLCDFGSSVAYIPAPKTPQEIQSVREDIMQHTTPQYRAPEMIDLTKGFPIDDKSDIWALGCFIYKLCYYTTPFESPNQTSLQDLEQSILNCNHTLRFNDQPGSMFSRRLKNIIACCLRPDPRRRPNAVQLLGEIASMKGDVLPSVIPQTVKEQLIHIKASESVESTNKLYDTFDRPKASKSVENLHVPDPFAAIDKSSLLTKPIAEVANRANNGRSIPPRPRSTYISPHASIDADYSKLNSNGYNSSKSTSALKDYVQKQLIDNDSRISNRKSSESERGTLDFLKSKEEEATLYKNDTGGSIKASIMNNLRKISTGSSINGHQSANNTGNNNYSKKSKISSIKKIITGNSQRKAGYEESSGNKVPEKANQPHVQKLSIQRRMQELMKNNEANPVQKSAQGYGRFTETKASDDIDAINAIPVEDKPKHHHHSRQFKKSLTPPKVPLSLSSSASEEKSKGMAKVRKTVTESSALQDNKPPVVVPVRKAQTEKLPPPKPKKPNYLKSDNTRRLSNSSDLSLPDLDDLEKQFSKRFPSYV
ncbi:putative actin-regulating kinase [Scheffersomyces coipomensis]|uniref:putative actin-regulating kinase n=1 Tax=Scheffersomyces coipomensis TaxID=1788519 RepID=UPI00315D5848